jgi:hypothetical protein
MSWKYMEEWRYSSTILNFGHTPLLLYPQGITSGEFCIGSWVGPRAVVDTMEKRKNALSLSPLIFLFSHVQSVV